MTKRGSVYIFVFHVTSVMNKCIFWKKKIAKHHNNCSVRIIHGQRVLIKNVCLLRCIKTEYSS